jgi:uncharacterized protein YbjT (DUF2867 family)
LNRATLAITGGTGFVGQTLLRLALEGGYRVRALTRTPQYDRPQVRWINGALDQPEMLVELVSGADAVIHVAGVVNAADRAGFERGNVAGTLAMIEAARAAGVARFIHVSSLSARAPELSHYGWSKARAETIVQASGLDWTIVRPPAIYGAGDRDMLDLFRFARRGVVPMPPKGRISVIEVSDLARLLLTLVDAPETRAAVYEPDDGRPGGWSHTEFGRAIGGAVGRSVIAPSLPRPVLGLASRIDRLVRGEKARLTADRVAYMCHPDWVADPARRPPATLWTPSVATPDGLVTTAQSYRDAGWL